MGVPEVNVGAVLNVQSDHLGLKGIDTLEQLAEVKRIVIEVATDCAVLNADDPLVLKMAGYTEAKNICYVTMNPQHVLVREHIRAGGRACALEAGVNGQMITLYDRGSHIPLVWTHLIPATLEGRALHNVQNAMFAAAMAFSLGIKLDAIRQGLRTFDSTFFQAPGPHERLQRASVQGAVRLRPQRACGRRDGRPGAAPRRARAAASSCWPGPGDRRDEDLRAIAEAVAGRFDHYICRRDDGLREPRADEVPRIQSAALQARGVAGSAISIIPDEQEAIDAALRMGQPGDLLLVFADALTRSWKQITKFRSAYDDRRTARRRVSRARARAEPVRASNRHRRIYRRRSVCRHASGISPAQRRQMGASNPHATLSSGDAAGAGTPVIAKTGGGAGHACAGESAESLLPGLIRDERGVRLAPETED